jgi:acetylornithine deacetylase/succinyl-diaminopimelate desuccinylase-like protein
MPSATAAARSGRGAQTQAAAGYARQHAQRAVEELKQFVRFPSVSAQPARAGDVRACGQWLAAHLRQLGLARVSLIDTPRHPLVYAEWCQAAGRPTVLIYGHYDVQPADPESQWRTPPFEPTVQGNDLLGRGACDDKGQLFTHVKAIEAYLRTTGKLPVNVKCLFEGEEEIGSPNLSPFIERNRHALTADVAVMSDTRMLGPGRPALTYSLRGALGMELTVHGPARDLHSGNFGGAIHNPLQALSELLSRLHDRQGRVTVPGFYERVRRWPSAERTEMARTGPRDAEVLRDAGARRGWGERGFSLYERTTIRPALTINGIQGGYRGSGGKAVIPARASAKISIRLVPDQDPRHIDRQVREHLRALVPPTVRCEIATQMMARPALVDRRHPVMLAAALAYRRGFGAQPVFVRSGGTIPVVNTFQRLLGIPTVLMGFALPDDRIHAPNEKFHLPNFHSGIRTSLEFLAGVARSLERP